MADREDQSRRRLRRIRAWGMRHFDRATARYETVTTRARQAIPALDLGWEFFGRFRRNNGAVLVGHLAYRLFLWLAPLMLVLAAGFGFSTSTFDIVAYVQDMGVSSQTAEDALAQAEASRVRALVIGLPALAIASWSLVRATHYAYSQVWGIEIRARKGAVRLALATVVFALVLAVLSMAITVVQRQGPLMALAGWAGGLMVTTAALWVAQWMMPRRTDRPFELLPGPLFAAIGVSAVNVFAAVYLPGRLASASVLYGSIGVAIAVLFYVFLLAYLLVIAPFVNAVWVDRAEILAGRAWVEDAEVGPRWARGALERLRFRGSGDEAESSEDASQA